VRLRNQRKKGIGGAQVLIESSRSLDACLLEPVQFSIERTPWTENLHEPQLEVRDGMVAIPAGPGWGVRLKESFLTATERQASER
jgi:L-alanine-DL-glutamate epimerase-like enolase superfamily enzyme